jgi:hypothetical protein
MGGPPNAVQIDDGLLILALWFSVKSVEQTTVDFLVSLAPRWGFREGERDE